MDVSKLKNIFESAAKELMRNEQLLSSIDAETGDGDHGITIAAIASAIIEVTEDNSINDEPTFFGRIFDEIMMINGGSIGPIWATMFDGISENVSANIYADGKFVYNTLEGALTGLKDVSDAKQGDKTLVDPLCAAIAAVEKLQKKTTKEAIAVAAGAAKEGAEATRNMSAKYGRAKNLPDKGLGHLDPGAVSFAIFIQGLNTALNENVED